MNLRGRKAPQLDPSKNNMCRRDNPSKQLGLAMIDIFRFRSCCTHWTLRPNMSPPNSLRRPWTTLRLCFLMLCLPHTQNKWLLLSLLGSFHWGNWNRTWPPTEDRTIPQNSWCTRWRPTKDQKCREHMLRNLKMRKRR